MPPLMLFRKLHKWVGLVLGVQLVIWTVSGAAMAIIDHHAVMGEHTFKAPAPPTLPAASLPLSAVQQSAPAGVTGFTLKPLLDRFVYEVRTPQGTHLIDSRTGERVVVDAALARAVALQQYAGTGSVKAVTRLATPNRETHDREGPLWRVQFDDVGDTAFYVAEPTGQLLDKRTNAFRAWHFFFMLHIMDYGQWQSFNHPLIWTMATAAVWIALTGVVLIFLAFRRQDFQPVLSLADRLRRPGRT